MKVQIIYLDPHDDYVSALDKLGWAKAPRILLVWPRRGRVLTRRLDLVLLQRNAIQRSAQIGLVTHDPEVRAHAKDLAIPVFDSLDQVPEYGWRRRTRKKPKEERQRGPPPADLLTPPGAVIPSQHTQTLYKIIRLSLTALALGALLLLAATIVPLAKITLTPMTYTQELELILSLEPNVDILQAYGSIPARWEHIQVEGSLRLPTTGSIAVPADFATGTVIFTNLTSDPITLPSNTGLRASGSDNLRYVTTEQVSLPGEEDSQAIARVQAASPGPAGNLPAGEIDAVEGPLGLLVVVINYEPMTGGSDEIRAAVSYTDRTILMRNLENQLIEQAATELAGKPSPDEALVLDSARLTQILDQHYDRQAGDPADSLELNLIMEVAGLIYRPADIESAAGMALEAELPSTSLPVPGTLYVEILSDPKVENDNSGSLTIIASQDTYEKIDFIRLQDLVRARLPEEATSILESLVDLSTRPQIRIIPQWFPRLPWLGMRITFHYQWQVE